MEQLKNNSITYIVQTDINGQIVDANNNFHDTFDHIKPVNVIDVVPYADYRRIIVNSERVRRESELTGEISRAIFECRTVNKEDQLRWGLFEIAYIRKYYYILGYDAYLAYEDGRGRIRQYEKVLRTVAHSLNHNIRSKSANITGLLGLIESKDSELVKHILLQAQEMDSHILNLTQIVNNSKR